MDEHGMTEAFGAPMPAAGPLWPPITDRMVALVERAEGERLAA